MWCLRTLPASPQCLKAQVPIPAFDSRTPRQRLLCHTLLFLLVRRWLFCLIIPGTCCTGNLNHFYCLSSVCLIVGVHSFFTTYRASHDRRKQKRKGLTVRMSLFGNVGATSTTAGQTNTTGDISKDVPLSSPPEDGISDLRFSPASEHLAVASWDKKVRIYEINEQGQSEGKALFEHEAPVLNCCWSPVKI